VDAGYEYSPAKQAAFQLAYLASTLCTALASGLLVGWIVRSTAPQKSGFFLDSSYFEVPEEEAGDEWAKTDSRFSAHRIIHDIDEIPAEP
jgi:hypothetical protein